MVLKLSSCFIGSFDCIDSALSARDEALDNIANGTFHELKKLRQQEEDYYPGVAWDKQSSKWRSTLRVNGKRVHIGFYVQKEDAIAALQNAVSCPPEHFLLGAKKTPVRIGASGHVGIHWHKQTSKWAATIAVDGGKTKHLGLFENITDAIAARNKALNAE